MIQSSIDAKHGAAEREARVRKNQPIRDRHSVIQLKAFVCRVKEFKLAELAISILEERLIEVDITQRETAAQQLESQRIGLVSEIEERFY